MGAKILNTIGLGSGICGVIMIFIWGPPQSVFVPGVSLGLDDLMAIDKPRLGLWLVTVGFVFQLAATWVPKKVNVLPIKIRTKLKTK